MGLDLDQFEISGTLVVRHRARLLAMHEVPRTLQRHKLKVRAEEFLLPLEH